MVVGSPGATALKSQLVLPPTYIAHYHRLSPLFYPEFPAPIAEDPNVRKHHLAYHWLPETRDQGDDQARTQVAGLRAPKVPGHIGTSTGCVSIFTVIGYCKDKIKVKRKPAHGILYQGQDRQVLTFPVIPWRHCLTPIVH